MQTNGIGERNNESAERNDESAERNDKSADRNVATPSANELFLPMIYRFLTVVCFFRQCFDGVLKEETSISPVQQVHGEQSQGFYPCALDSCVDVEQTIYVHLCFYTICKD
ncbi:MAG: hypothetical protein ACI3YC_09445 [Alloprevotella sp.]